MSIIIWVYLWIAGIWEFVAMCADSNIVSAITTLVTALATLGAVYLANWLTYKRINKVRTRELKMQSYGLILSELAQANRLSDTIDEYMAEDAHRYFVSDDRIELEKKLYKHVRDAHECFTKEYLTMSDEFIDMYEQFHEELSGDSSDSFPDERERFSEVLNRSRPALMVLARREINK